MESNLGDFLPASTCPTWWCDNCWESRQEPIQPIKGSHFYGRQIQQIRGNLTDFWSAPNLHCASNWYVAYCRVFCVTRIWRWHRKMLWFSFRWKGQFAAWQGLDCPALVTMFSGQYPLDIGESRTEHSISVKDVIQLQPAAAVSDIKVARERNEARPPATRKLCHSNPTKKGHNFAWMKVEGNHKLSVKRIQLSNKGSVSLESSRENRMNPYLSHSKTSIRKSLGNKGGSLVKKV